MISCIKIRQSTPGTHQGLHDLFFFFLNQGTYVEKLLKLQQIMTVRQELYEIKLRNGAPMGLESYYNILRSQRSSFSQDTGKH